MKFTLLSPALGAASSRSKLAPESYNSVVSISEPASAVSAPSKQAFAISVPWRTSIVVGWAALAAGTIVTIVIVVVAVTLP